MSLSHIDKYEVISTLGRGSMGVVYKARDPEIGRTVAIKTLRSMYMGDDASGKEALERFRQESRSAGRLHHPNIVMVFSAGKTEEGSPYICMEYVAGKGVDAILQEEKKLSPSRTIHVLAQVAGAIDYAHSQNVIHRDIKPSNIIIDEHQRPHLLDFGVAKLSDTSLTPAGTVVGTPSYMSPEQIRGEELDGKTDLFALAVVAFEMLTGERPFPGKDFTTVVSNIIHKEPRTFSEVGSDLPKELELVLFRGLSKERDRRYSDAFSFVQALADVYALRIGPNGIAGGYSPEMKLQPVTDDVTQVVGSDTVDAVHRVVAELKDAAHRSELASMASSLETPKRSSSRMVGFGAVALAVIAGAVFFAFRDSKLSASSFSSPQREEQSTDGLSEDDAAVDPVDVHTESVDDHSIAKSTAPDSGPKAFAPQPTRTPESGWSSAALAALSDEQIASVLADTTLGRDDAILVVEQAAKRENLNLVPYFQQQLQHPHFKVRIALLKALRESPLDQKKLRAVYASGLQDKEYLVRGFAAKALGVDADREVQQLLEAQLAREDNEIVRKVLQQALRRDDAGASNE